MLSSVAAAWCLGVLVKGQQSRSDPAIPANQPVAGVSDYGRKHALLIGINRYRSLPGMDLSFAMADAKEFGEVLKAGYGFGDVEVVPPSESDLGSIRTRLSRFLSSDLLGGTDLVIVFFACHAEVDADGSAGYFLVSDSRPSNQLPPLPSVEMSSCLPMKEVRAKLEACGARHTLLIADACFGGVLMTDRSGLGLPGRGGLGLSQVRDFISQKARRLMSASDSSQTAREDPTLQHGVLTAMLLRELYARPVGQAFDLTDLFGEVRQSVMAYTGSMQRPRLGAADSGADIVFRPVAQVLPPSWLTNVPSAKPALTGRPFSLPVDVPATHWCADSIRVLGQGGLSFVYADNEFKGNRPLSRYEMAQELYMVSRSTHSLAESQGARPPLDVPNDHWAAQALSQLISSGALSGDPIFLYPDRKFHGERPTSRGEYALALACLAHPYMTSEERDGPILSSLFDSNEKTYEYFPVMGKAISQLTRAGILSQYPDNLFRIGRPISRYESLAMLASLYSFLGDRAHRGL